MSSIDEFRAYLALEGQRLDLDVEYWQDELRKFPLPSIASQYQLALVRQEVFNTFSHDLSALLLTDCHKTND